VGSSGSVVGGLDWLGLGSVLLFNGISPLIMYRSFNAAAQNLIFSILRNVSPTLPAEGELLAVAVTEEEAMDSVGKEAAEEDIGEAEEGGVAVGKRERRVAVEGGLLNRSCSSFTFRLAFPADCSLVCRVIVAAVGDIRIDWKFIPTGFARL